VNETIITLACILIGSLIASSPIMERWSKKYERWVYDKIKEKL